jgi:hypothetical protein
VVLERVIGTGKDPCSFQVLVLVPRPVVQESEEALACLMEVDQAERFSDQIAGAVRMVGAQDEVDAGGTAAVAGVGVVEDLLGIVDFLDIRWEEVGCRDFEDPKDVVLQGRGRGQGHCVDRKVREDVDHSH